MPRGGQSDPTETDATDTVALVGMRASASSIACRAVSLEAVCTGGGPRAPTAMHTGPDAAAMLDGPRAKHLAALEATPGRSMSLRTHTLETLYFEHIGTNFFSLLYEDLQFVN